MNQVALAGTMTDDPELRYTQSGAALAGFTVAVTHRSKHNGGGRTSTTGSSAARHNPRGPLCSSAAVLEYAIPMLTRNPQHPERIQMF